MSALETSLSLADTVERVRSGVFHIVFLNDAGERLGSGSAFTAANHLITNGHVFDAPSRTARVWIRREEHTLLQQGIVLPILDFRSRRVFASAEEEYDYAVLKIDELFALAPYQFRLTGHSKTRIGKDVCFFRLPLKPS